MITKTVLHVDGKTKVSAKGMVINGEFVGEYKFQGMTYGVTIPEYIFFEKETPKEFTPLEVVFSDGKINNAYYVKWSNTFYANLGSPMIPVVKWRYI